MKYITLVTVLTFHNIWTTVNNEKFNYSGLNGMTMRRVHDAKIWTHLNVHIHFLSCSTAKHKHATPINCNVTFWTPSSPSDTCWHQASPVLLVQVAVAQAVVTTECQLSCWLFSLACLGHCPFPWSFARLASFPDWPVSLAVLGQVLDHLLQIL